MVEKKKKSERESALFSFISSLSSRLPLPSLSLSRCSLSHLGMADEARLLSQLEARLQDLEQAVGEPSTKVRGDENVPRSLSFVVLSPGPPCCS